MLIKVPDNHRIGTRVPEGGSSCASCKYLQQGNTCGNKYWLAWHKEPLIPEDADEYCCDFYEERRASER